VGVETDASDAHGADGAVIEAQHSGLLLLPTVEHSIQLVDVTKVFAEPLASIRAPAQTVVR